MKQFNLRLWIIQNIRFAQAVMEVDDTVGIPAKFEDILVHINEYYKSPYRICKEDDELMKASYNHKDPFVKLGEHKMPLVFPMCMIDFLKRNWGNKSKRSFVFVGFKWSKRDKALDKWEAREDTNVVWTTNGREFPSKSWDEDYYDLMLKSQFALCPDGGWVWTYRFFEAIMCGCIPVVQSKVDVYDGFEFYYMADKEEDIVYDKDIAERNLSLLIERCTFENKDISGE